MKLKTRMPLTICSLLLLLTTVAYAANPNILTIDGVQSESENTIINGFTYVPMREFFQAIAQDSVITWNAATQTATARCNGLEVVVEVGACYVKANDRYFYLPDGVYVESRKIFLPVSLMTQFFGAQVHWSNGYEELYVTEATNLLTPASQYYNDEDLYWLSRIISAESKGEPLLGKIAVGNVVLNRVASSSYPSSVEGVVFDRKFGVQFTPAYSGSIYNAPTAESVIAAKICLEGTSVAGDSLFFFNKSISTSRWIEKNCQYVTTIGQHSFYA